MTFTQVMGRIGRDPESRFTSGGQKVTTFSVAVNKKKKGVDVTNWYRVTVWGDQFDKMMPYVKKGSLIVAMGELEASIYTDKEGKPQISNDLTAWKLDFVPSSNKAENNAASGSGGYSGSGAPASREPYQRNEEPYQRNEYSSEPMKGTYQSGPSYASEDELKDLPF